MIPGLKELDYEERLKKIRLPSMKYRRERGDMIEVYKYTHGLYSTPQPFTVETNKTRGHSLKIKKQQPKAKPRQAFFSIRIENNWNSLPEHIVNTKTINGFKNGLDRHWSNRLYTI